MENPINLLPLQTYFAQQPVIRAWLFGSQVDGSATPESDVDILVELDYTKQIGLHFVQMIWDLEHILHKKVDLVPHDSLSKYIAPYIEQQKKVIYERQ
ncbi:MAG: nucleotidyltransferase [Bacteroidetes bacterium]|nr:MAG: nucleotidyltransferase [Bacteroidota bacterium]